MKKDLDYAWELYRLKSRFELSDEDIKVIKKFSGAKTNRDLVFEIEKLIEEGGIK